MPYIVSVTLTIEADSEDDAWEEYKYRVESGHYSKDSISIDLEENPDSEPEQKKPLCPKCGKELDELNIVVSEKNMYSYCDGEIVWANAGEQFEYSIDKFNCPHCHETLFTEEEEADAFLKGETDNQGV